MAKLQKGKGMSGDELKKAIAAYNARRKTRLDEAEKAEEAGAGETLNEDVEGLTGEPPAEAEPQSATAEQRVQLVKDRRDRRDQEGDPETPEAAMGVIAQQDEDIDELLEVVEELMAQSDFSETAEDNAKADEENEDEENEDEEPAGAGGGVTLEIRADEMDRIVRERLELGKLGERLRLDGLEKMKPLAAKKAIIKKVNPRMNLDGKGKTYVNAAFDAAVAQLEALGDGKGGKDVNYQRRQMTGRADGRNDCTATGKTSAQLARERMIDRQLNGGTEQ